MLRGRGPFCRRVRFRGVPSSPRLPVPDFEGSASGKLDDLNDVLAALGLFGIGVGLLWQVIT